MMLIAVLLSAYLVGAIPFSAIVAFILTKEDIRTRGSGNAGASNVLRTLGWKAALPAVLGDFFKAFIPVYMAEDIMQLTQLTDMRIEYFSLGILFFIMMGHVFPVWLKFRGGKGVASAAGGISALFPPAFPFCLILFAVVAGLTRYASLASLVTAWVLPLYYLLTAERFRGSYSPVLLVFFLVTACLITVFHRKNIRRLIQGNENTIEIRKQR